MFPRMPVSKVKLKNLRTGQEFLLLVVKMNSKGLLVRSSHQIEESTPLLLTLQLGDDGPPLELRGEVHKTVRHPGGSTGIILRFVDPPARDTERIQAYVDTHEAEPDGPHAMDPRSPLQEKTAMAEIASLSRLALSSPDRPSDSIQSTQDEETLDAQNPGLAGKTRTFDTEYPPSGGGGRRFSNPLRSGLKIAVGVAVALLLVLTLRHPLVRFLDRHFGVAPAPTAVPIAVPEPSPTADQPEPTPSPAPAPTETPPPRTPTPSPGILSAYDVHDEGSFLKVSVRGRGDFTRHASSRALNPKRLIVELPGIRAFSAPETVLVGKNPVLRIRTQSGPKGLRVIFDLYPVPFPRYQIKARADSLVIFFQR